MTFFIILTLLYFLPAIIGHRKRQAGMIFLVNFLAGWTIVGWVICLIWACMPDEHRVVALAGNTAVHYCTWCGTPQFVGGHYCAGCGRSF